MTLRRGHRRSAAAELRAHRCSSIDAYRTSMLGDNGIRGWRDGRSVDWMSATAKPNPPSSEMRERLPAGRTLGANQPPGRNRLAEKEPVAAPKLRRSRNARCRKAVDRRPIRQSRRTTIGHADRAKSAPPTMPPRRPCDPTESSRSRYARDSREATAQKFATHFRKAKTHAAASGSRTSSAGSQTIQPHHSRQDPWKQRPAAPIQQRPRSARSPPRQSRGRRLRPDGAAPELGGAVPGVKPPRERQIDRQRGKSEQPKHRRATIAVADSSAGFKRRQRDGQRGAIGHGSKNGRISKDW